MSLEDEVKQFMDADGWIAGRSKSKIDILNLTPGMVNINDIAIGLARESRFRGQGTAFLSVAQHSLRVSYLAPKLSGDAAEIWGDPARYLHQIALYGLLHDAAEYGLGDIARPLKRLALMTTFRAIDHTWQEIIYQKYGLLPTEPAVIKEADMMVCLLEAKRHMLEVPWSAEDHTRASWCQWQETNNVDDLDFPREKTFGEHGAARFLERFRELTSK